MPIRIKTIRTQCALCKDFTPPNGELTGFVSGSGYEKWQQSAKKCTGCKFLVAVISAANSMGISGSHAAIFIDGSQGSVPRFTVNLTEWGQWYCGRVQVCALQGILELNSVCSRVTYSSNSEHDLWETITHGGALPKKTNTDESLNQAISWIDQCKSKHSSCRVSVDATLPTRVLDLSDKVRLHVGNGERAEYVCLSHTGGYGNQDSDHLCKTTKKNLTERLKDIPWTELPRGYQDAITVCRSLGQRYLWIDTFCVVQDDREDWTREVSQIGKIYGNAMLTIFATGSGSHNYSMFYNNSIQTITATYKGKDYQFQVAPTVEHLCMSSEQQELKFPLLQRGWVLQERLLSRRVLHFGQQELFWECCEEVKCQCSLVNHAAESKSNLSAMALQARKITHNLLLLSAETDSVSDVRSSALARRFRNPYSADEFQNGIIPRKWRDLVSEYSGQRFSRESDRLAGISGLARQMQEYRRSKYLAGLWEDSLWMDLLWIGGLPDAKRDERRTAPSWSWASLPGKVTWSADGLLLCNPQFGLDIHYSLEPSSTYYPHIDPKYEPILGRNAYTQVGWPNMLNPSAIGFELLEAECVGRWSDTITAVSSGRLKVSSYLLADDYPYSKFIQPASREQVHHIICVGQHSVIAAIDDVNWAYEYDGKVRLLSPLVLLRVACTPIGPYKGKSHAPGYYEWSLLLKAVPEGPPYFRRCGIAVVKQCSMEKKDSKWYGAVAKPATVVLL
jgi:Heterokaryon incompatibility protein (HET)